MTILDAVIFLMLLLGAVLGFKKGFIKTLVSLIGIILVLIISFHLKNPIANFMIKYFPFFNFTGKFAGMFSLNILLYEAIAFLIVFIFLSSILGIIINVTGIIEKVLNATIVLGIFSKILGALAGVLEMIVFLFIGLFAMSQFALTNDLIMQSEVSKTIIISTPILNKYTANSYVAVRDIYKLYDKYKDSDDKTAYNVEAISIMLRYNVVDGKIIQELIDNNKIELNGVVFY